MKKNVETVALFFDSLSNGDMDTVVSLIDDNIIWHQPGQGVLSGIINGKSNVLEHLGRFMELSQGTFSSSYDYLTPNGDLVAVAVQFKAAAKGKSISMKGVDLVKVNNHKITEFWLFSEFIDEEDKFWTALAS